MLRALVALSDDMEIRDHDIPDADVYRGHAGYLEWLSRWSESWDSFRIEDLDVRPVGEDRAIAFFELVATGRGSGVEVRRRDAITYQLRDAKVVRQDYYNDQAEARRALGLSE